MPSMCDIIILNNINGTYKKSLSANNANEYGIGAPL